VDGETWTTDVVVLSTGMRPNTALGKESGLDIGPSGGLATDDRLHCTTGGSPIPNVYTLGDCAEVRDAVTGHPRLSQLASTTLLESRVVCANLSGGSARLSGVVSPQVTAMPGLNAASVGLTSAHAENAGIDFTESTGQAKSRAGYYPGAGTCTAKLLFEQDRLIGAQLVSPGEVHGTLDMLVQFILQKGGAEEILSMERAFSPPLVMLEDAVAKAAAGKPRHKENGD
jgi:NADH oxidase (H2O2-forming)